jgi:hypothetical protein
VTDEIPVLFQTNAATAAADVDRLANSVRKQSDAIGKSAKKWNETTQSMAGWQRHASKYIQQAEEITRIERTQAKQRTQDLQMVAKAQKSQGGGGFLGKAISAAGGGQGLGLAKAALGAGAGAASLIGTTLAFTGAGIAIGALVTVIGDWIDSAEKQAERSKELADALNQAKQNSADRGLDATRKLQSEYRPAAATGMLSIADSVKSGAGGLSDALKAANLAHELFPGMEQKMVSAALTASKIQGGNVSDFLNPSNVTGANPAMLDARGLASLAGGREISARDWDSRMHTLSSNEPIAQMDRVNATNGMIEAFGLLGLKDAADSLTTQFATMRTEIESATRAVTTDKKETAKASARVAPQAGSVGSELWGFH